MYTAYFCNQQAQTAICIANLQNASSKQEVVVDDSENKIQTLLATALCNNNVKNARCLYFDNTYVVAIITQPFFLKSERDAYQSTLQSMLSQQTDDMVIVSFDTDVYRYIRQNMQDSDKQKIVDIVKRRANIK